jgi:DNA-binding transcriptional LysR family regulator
VLAGAGLAFLPKIAVAQDIGSGALAEVRVGRKKLERNFRFVWHRARRLSADLQLVRECALALRE